MTLKIHPSNPAAATAVSACWTTDVFPDVNLQNYAFSPTDENTQPYFRTTRVNVWAVHDYRAVPVPEPGSMALAAVALLVMTTLAHRSRNARRRRGSSG